MLRFSSKINYANVTFKIQINALLFFSFFQYYEHTILSLHYLLALPLSPLCSQRAAAQSTYQGIERAFRLANLQICVTMPRPNTPLAALDHGGNCPVCSCVYPFLYMFCGLFSSHHTSTDKENRRYIFEKRKKPAPRTVYGMK